MALKSSGRGEEGEAFGEGGGGAFDPVFALGGGGEGGVAHDALRGDVAGGPGEREGGAFGAEFAGVVELGGVVADGAGAAHEAGREGEHEGRFPLAGVEAVGGFLGTLGGLEAAGDHAEAEAEEILEFADEGHEHGAVAAVCIENSDTAEAEAVEFGDLGADECGEGAGGEGEGAGPVGVFVALADDDRLGGEDGHGVGQALEGAGEQALAEDCVNADGEVRAVLFDGSGGQDGDRAGQAGGGAEAFGGHGAELARAKGTPDGRGLGGGDEVGRARGLADAVPGGLDEQAGEAFGGLPEDEAGGCGAGFAKGAGGQGRGVDPVAGAEVFVARFLGHGGDGDDVEHVGGKGLGAEPDGVGGGGVEVDAEGAEVDAIDSEAGLDSDVAGGGVKPLALPGAGGEDEEFGEAGEFNAEGDFAHEVVGGFEGDAEPAGGGGGDGAEAEGRENERGTGGGGLGGGGGEQGVADRAGGIDGQAHAVIGATVDREDCEGSGPGGPGGKVGGGEVGPGGVRMGLGEPSRSHAAECG